MSLKFKPEEFRSAIRKADRMEEACAEHAQKKFDEWLEGQPVIYVKRPDRIIPTKCGRDTKRVVDGINWGGDTKRARGRTHKARLVNIEEIE
jgi:hypothetical protein